MVKKRNIGLGDTIKPWRVSSNQEGNYKTNVPINATLIGAAATTVSTIFIIFRSLFGESDTIMTIMTTVWLVASVIQIPLVLAFTIKHQKKKSKINPVVPETLQFHDNEHDSDVISNEVNEVTTDNDGLSKVIMTPVDVYDHVESIDDPDEESVKAAENCNTGDYCEDMELAVSSEEIKLTEIGEASGQLPSEVCHI